jgi:hypothetical protein
MSSTFPFPLSADHTVSYPPKLDIYIPSEPDPDSDSDSNSNANCAT